MNLEGQLSLALISMNGQPFTPMMARLDPKNKAWYWKLERLQRR